MFLPIKLYVLIIAVLFLSDARAQSSPINPSTFLNLAYSSYCPFTPIREWNCFWCTKSDTPILSNVTTIYDSVRDMLVYVGAGDLPVKSKPKSTNPPNPAIFIVFRGTEMHSVRDWIQDIDTPISKINDSNVDKVYPYTDQVDVGIHDGFFGAYSALRSQFLSNLQALLKAQCQGKCPLYITGHSLGGALATLAALDLARLGLTVTQLFTMGSPRVGNSEFATYFSTLKVPSLRLVNEADVVPHLPPQEFGFRHIATENWFHNGVFTTCNDSGEDPKCSDSVEPWDYSASDHTHYLGVDLGSKAAAAQHCDGVYDNNGPAQWPIS